MQALLSTRSSAHDRLVASAYQEAAAKISLSRGLRCAPLKKCINRLKGGKVSCHQFRPECLKGDCQACNELVRSACEQCANSSCSAGGLTPHGQRPHVRWLHFPKCGTTFQLTVVRHACTEQQNPAWHIAYLAMGQGIGQHYKVARSLAHDRDKKASARSRNRGTCCGGRILLPFLGHQPVKERELQLRGWAPSDLAGGTLPAGGLVAMFRRPAQRLISAFLDKRHTGGTNAVERRTLPHNLSGFARHPGVAGCMTKMLTGRDCGAPVGIGDAAVARAVALVRSPAFRYVGLVEEWDRSICLFHRMMGARA